MKITFIGDIFPADEYLSLGFGIKSKFEKTKGVGWKDNILNATKGSNIVIGNLESPLLDSSFANKPDFYGSPSFADFLKNCGIGVLNIANNHILEHGKLGYEKTLEALNQSDISVVGNDNHVLYLHHDNCLIGIAGFCNVDLDRFVNDGCFSELNEKNVMSALREMCDRKVDLKIFTLHWGNEYIHRPSMEQRTIAYKLIDAGVDIIVGHHPHVIQPYEKYKSGHIFYSLGNFCFSNPFQSRQFSKGMGVILNYDTIQKALKNISFFGVKLSQDNLVHKVDSAEFNFYFNKIQKKYLAMKDKKTYCKKYEKELVVRHLAERVLMKISLLRLYFNLSYREKQMLLRNLIQYYWK